MAVVRKSDYKAAKREAFRKYSKVGRVYCPNLKRKVGFNSNGFWHIVYKSRHSKRDNNSQLMRFRILSKAAKLVKETTTIQEYDSYTAEIPVKDHKAKVLKVTKIEYFGYIAIVDGWKIKVIVKKIGNGSPFFWSVIPNWVTNKKRDARFMFKNFTGNLEED